jgi:hypothetical protein
MTLIVEDGTGVANANSYISVADARTYASARGTTLPSDDSAVEALILQGMSYIEAQRARFQGSKTYTGVVGFHDDDWFPIPLPPDVNTHAAQALQWPRYDVYIDDIPLSGSAIPVELVSALAQCAVEISSGNDLQANTTGTPVKIEKVDVIETQYMTPAEMNTTGFSASYPKVESLLQPLYSSSGALLSTVRV